MTDLRRNQNEMFEKLPPQWPDDPLPEIRALLHSSDQKVVVLDDDPTGTQTVHDVPVLTDWSLAALTEELRDPGPAMFVLTNSRSMPLAGAQACNSEIGRNLVAASQAAGRGFVVISRSDSTLRGHFPGEIDALADAVGVKFDSVLIIPAFMAGGRYTLDDVHYVAEDGWLVPAGQTQFAQDTAFGYASSNLRDWVAEKTSGRVRREEVTSISLEDIRLRGPDGVAERLLRTDGRCCVINAITERDLAVVALGAMQAEALGKRLLYRTAASFAALRAGIALRPLLTGADMNLFPTGGGLVVVGSYIPKSSEQLRYLLNAPGVKGVEARVNALLADDPLVEINRVIGEVDERLRRNEIVVVYTSRDLITGGSADDSLAIGGRVSAGLVAIVRGLQETPRMLIAKGGITSSDLATKALDVRRAWVMGQILPGVPVWKLGPESRQPGMAYVVFPGNVGGPDALLRVVEKLR